MALMPSHQSPSRPSQSPLSHGPTLSTHPSTPLTPITPFLSTVMALMPELDMDDLVYVKREIEQRLGMGSDMSPAGPSGSPGDAYYGGGGGSGRRRDTPPPIINNGLMGGFDGY
eukprot:364355-Chlamydomonas_euryale.AAC.5